MKEGGRGGFGEADGDERKIGNVSKTASEISVYMHVHRSEEGLEHLGDCSSEDVCHISCFLLFAFT